MCVRMDLCVSASTCALCGTSPEGRQQATKTTHNHAHHQHKCGPGFSASVHCVAVVCRSAPALIGVEARAKGRCTVTADLEPSIGQRRHRAISSCTAIPGLLEQEVPQLPYILGWNVACGAEHACSSSISRYPALLLVCSAAHLKPVCITTKNPSLPRVC